MDMYIDCYWTDTLGCDDAKVRNYVYIEIVITRNYDISRN
jgi:hypothetical protein